MLQLANLKYPTINMARDPRWGRDEENYGEDPFLTGAVSAGSVEAQRSKI